MFIFSLQKKLNDTSISKKLYFTIGFTALLVMIELCTLWFSITTLSALRSYVGGEGLWSKAQKDAVLNLREYAYSHKEKDYKAFREFLKVPYGDKIARMELEKPAPDYEIAEKNLLQGRNHPDDIKGMIRLLRRFHNIYYLKKAFTAWAKAEPVLGNLVQIGERLHVLVTAKAGSAEIAGLLIEIDHINQELTKLEDNFSFTLGEGARWLEGFVLKLVLTLSLTIGITSIFIAISINRSLKKGVDAIIKSAELIREGKLKTRVPVYSKDEIGMVAIAFNEMTSTLDHKIKELKFTEENMVKEKDRAEKSEKAKHQFLVNMSHEMRTPMNAILGFARHLEGSVTNNDQKDSIKMIVSSGNHLLATLNEILDFSKIAAGEISFVKLPFNLRDIIQSVVKLIEQNAVLKKIELSYVISNDISCTLYGDAVRLKQILLSLASNALKFTERGSIAISVNTITSNAEYALIEFKIKDTGIGIPKEKQERIFELFEQGSNDMTRKFGGTGIGLSIVKHLITLQHGEISVNSIPGKGSEFCFRLLFSKAGDVQHNTPSQNIIEPISLPSNYGNDIRVLVVEDNAINQLLVLKLLQKYNYKTTVAENGRIALRKFMEADFDIILMDLQMPEMDGYEATVNIRNLNSDKKNVPIVAMTAHTTIGDFERCMEIGINDYISKPFHPAELYGKIQLLVQHSNLKLS